MYSKFFNIFICPWKIQILYDREVGMVITEVNMENCEYNCIKQKDRKEDHEKLKCWVREINN